MQEQVLIMTGGNARNANGASRDKAVLMSAFFIKFGISVLIHLF